MTEQQPTGDLAGLFAPLASAYNGLAQIYSLYQFFSGMPTEQEKIKAELDKIQQQIANLSAQVSAIPAQIQEELIGQQYYVAYNSLLQDVISYEKGELILKEDNTQDILDKIDNFNLAVTGLGSDPSFLHLHDQELRRTYSLVIDYFQSMSPLCQMSASLLTRLNRMLGQCAPDLWLHAGVQERFRTTNDSIKFVQDFVDKAGMYTGDAKKPRGPVTEVALLLVDDVRAKPEEWKLAQSRPIYIYSSQVGSECIAWYEALLPFGGESPAFFISCGLPSEVDFSSVVDAFTVRPANDKGSNVTFGFAERHFWGPLKAGEKSPCCNIPADNKGKCPPFPSSWYEFQFRVGSSGDASDQFLITTSTNRNRYDTDSAGEVWCWRWHKADEDSSYYSSDGYVDMSPIPADGTPLGADWLFTIRTHFFA